MRHPWCTAQRISAFCVGMTYKSAVSLSCLSVSLSHLDPTIYCRKRFPCRGAGMTKKSKCGNDIQVSRVTVVSLHVIVGLDPTIYCRKRFPCRGAGMTKKSKCGNDIQVSRVTVVSLHVIVGLDPTIYCRKRFPCRGAGMTQKSS